MRTEGRTGLQELTLTKQTGCLSGRYTQRVAPPRPPGQDPVGSHTVYNSGTRVHSRKCSMQEVQSVLLWFRLSLFFELVQGCRTYTTATDRPRGRTSLRQQYRTSGSGPTPYHPREKHVAQLCTGKPEPPGLGSCLPRVQTPDSLPTGGVSGVFTDQDLPPGTSPSRRNSPPVYTGTGQNLRHVRLAGGADDSAS